MGDGGDVGDAQGAPGGQHDSHGDDWPPGPPENACTAVGELIQCFSKSVFTYSHFIFSL